MAVFDYVNLVYWLVALAGLVAWLRFSTFMCDDITQNLVDQPELPWKLGAVGAALVMLIVFIVMPSFWIALPVNVAIAGGIIAAFWVIRVKVLGASGHLFKGALSTAVSVTRGMEERKNARQVHLTYLRHDNSPMPLPRPQDPLAAGLGTADSLMIQAISRRAEMVDLAPAGEGYAVNMVTDGVPSLLPGVSRVTAEAAIQAFKVLAGLSAEERRRLQTGSFRSRDGEGGTTNWTVRTSGSTAGERLVLSANERGQWDIPVDQLGMSSEQLADVKKLAADTHGLVIVAAPKGQGRTATVYALLRQHDAFTNSVQTLEVNPQTEIEGVTVNRFTGAAAGGEGSYSKLLQSIMLKDPNVVMVSQVPDPQSADLIAKYAGGAMGEARRIYTSLTAPESFSALEMWLNMSPRKSDAANCLRAVISQRLVRILCPTCKIPYQPDEATMKRLNLPVGRNLQSFKANTEPIVDRKGHSIICPDCGGIGFKGRTGIFEVLVITDEMKKVLSGGGNMNQIKVLARKNNLLFLVEHGIRKFAAGVTAIHEVTRVMSPPGGGGPSGKTGGMQAQK